MLSIGVILFFNVIRQISRSHGTKNRRFWPKLGVFGLWPDFELTDGYEMMHRAWSSIEEVRKKEFKDQIIFYHVNTKPTRARFWMIPYGYVYQILWSSVTYHAHNIICLYIVWTLFTRANSISLDKGGRNTLTWHILPLADFMFTRSNKLGRKHNMWWRIGMRMIRFMSMFYAINMSLRYKTVSGISVMFACRHNMYGIYSGLILGLRPANERRSYFITTSLIGWLQT